MARPTRKMMIIAAAVVAVAAIGGAATYFATSPTATSSAQATQTTGHGKAGKSGREGRSEKARARKAERGGGAGGMLAKIEHGEFTTASAGVMQIQRGAITAIDAGSVTVRSADGYTASYTITPTTAVGKGGKGGQVAAEAPTVAPAPGQLQAGDTVQVMATKTDGGSTATRIAPART